MARRRKRAAAADALQDLSRMMQQMMLLRLQSDIIGDRQAENAELIAGRQKEGQQRTAGLTLAGRELDEGMARRKKVREGTLTPDAASADEASGLGALDEIRALLGVPVPPRPNGPTDYTLSLSAEPTRRSRIGEALTTGTNPEDLPGPSAVPRLMQQESIPTPLRSFDPTLQGPEDPRRVADVAQFERLRAEAENRLGRLTSNVQQVLGIGPEGEEQRSFVREFDASPIGEPFQTERTPGQDVERRAEILRREEESGIPEELRARAALDAGATRGAEAAAQHPYNVGIEDLRHQNRLAEQRTARGAVGDTGTDAQQRRAGQVTLLTNLDATVTELEQRGVTIPAFWGRLAARDPLTFASMVGNWAMSDEEGQILNAAQQYSSNVVQAMSGAQFRIDEFGRFLITLFGLSSDTPGQITAKQQLRAEYRTALTAASGGAADVSGWQIGRRIAARQLAPDFVSYLEMTPEFELGLDAGLNGLPLPGGRSLTIVRSEPLTVTSSQPPES